MKKMLLSTVAAVTIIVAPAVATAQQAEGGRQTAASDKLDRARTANDGGGERLGKPGEMAKSDAEKAEDAKVDQAKAEGQADGRLTDSAKTAADDRARSDQNARAEDKSVIGDRARDKSDRQKAGVSARADGTVKSRSDRTASARDRARLSYSERSRSVDVESRERARNYARASYRDRDRLDVNVRARDGYSGRGYRRDHASYASTTEYGRYRDGRVHGASVSSARETVGVEGGVRRSGVTTAEQRTTMRQRFASVDRSHRVDRSTLGSTRIVEGADVPRTVAVERVPARVVETTPEYRDYSYFTTDDDHVVVVNPRTYKVITVVEDD